MKTETEPGSKM